MLWPSILRPATKNCPLPVGVSHATTLTSYSGATVSMDASQRRTLSGVRAVLAHGFGFFVLQHIPLVRSSDRVYTGHSSWCRCVWFRLIGLQGVRWIQGEHWLQCVQLKSTSDEGGGWGVRNTLLSGNPMKGYLWQGRDLNLQCIWVKPTPVDEGGGKTAQAFIFSKYITYPQMFERPKRGVFSYPQAVEAFPAVVACMPWLIDFCT